MSGNVTVHALRSSTRNANFLEPGFAGQAQAQSATTCSCCFLAHGFFYPADGGDTFLRNVSSHKIYTAPSSQKVTFFIVTAVKTSKPTNVHILTIRA
jgi:hypothetical protein